MYFEVLSWIISITTTIKTSQPQPIGPWSSWTSCSVPCGGGTRLRSRVGGKNEIQTQECNQERCPRKEIGMNVYSLKLALSVLFKACIKFCDLDVNEGDSTVFIRTEIFPIRHDFILNTTTNHLKLKAD